MLRFPIFLFCVLLKLISTKYTSQLEHDKSYKMNKLSDCGGDFISFKVMVILLSLWTNSQKCHSHFYSLS